MFIKTLLRPLSTILKSKRIKNDYLPDTRIILLCVKLIGMNHRSREWTKSGALLNYVS